MATKLTKKEKKFANKFIDTGNGTQSALEVYDTESENTAAVIAHRTLRKDKIQEYIADHAEKAESKIFQLSQKAKSEMVSLVASKDIMDRAGFKPVDRSESKSVNLNIDTRPENKDLEEIRQRFIGELKNKLSQ